MGTRLYTAKRRLAEFSAAFLAMTVLIGGYTLAKKNYHFGDSAPQKTAQQTAAAKATKTAAETKKSFHAAAHAFEPETAAERAAAEQAVKSLLVSEKQRKQQIASIKKMSAPEIMEKLKKPIDPILTKDGKPLFDQRETKLCEGKDERLLQDVRSAVRFAVDNGVWDTMISFCDALGFSPSDAFALGLFESSLAKDGANGHTTADGLYQVLNRSFLEMFARHGRTMLPVIKKVDPKTGHEMAPLVDLVEINDASGGSFVYNQKAYKNLVGKHKAAKMSDKEIEDDIKKKVMALRSPQQKEISQRVMVSGVLALRDLSLKVPANRDGLACLPRLIHNYGEGGGKIIARAYKKTPEKSMFDVVSGIYESAFSSNSKRDAFVSDLLVANGIRTKAGKVDKSVTVGAFVGNMDRRWRMAVNCFDQMIEKMQMVEALNEHFSEIKAPLRVVWDTDGESMFSMVATPQSKPKAFASKDNIGHAPPNAKNVRGQKLASLGR